MAKAAKNVVEEESEEEEACKIYGFKIYMNTLSNLEDTFFGLTD